MLQKLNAKLLCIGTILLFNLSCLSKSETVNDRSGINKDNSEKDIKIVKVKSIEPNLLEYKRKSRYMGVVTSSVIHEVPSEVEGLIKKRILEI